MIKNIAKVKKCLFLKNQLKSTSKKVIILKRFYNRETIAALYRAIHHTLLANYVNYMIVPFLNSRFSANHDKVERLSANMLESL